jgi:hypothetical protein
MILNAWRRPFSDRFIRGGLGKPLGTLRRRHHYVSMGSARRF